MCGDCWEAAGEPTEWTDQTARFIEAVRDLYQFEPMGGPLHAVLDDWNLRGLIEPYWPAQGIAGDLEDDDPDMARIAALCTEIAALLNGWTEPQRYAALAYERGYVEPPLPPRCAHESPLGRCTLVADHPEGPQFGFFTDYHGHVYDGETSETVVPPA